MADAELTAENKFAYENRRRTAHEYQGGVGILAILLDVVRIVLGRLPLAHRVEVGAKTISLDGLGETSDSILEATSSQWSVMQAIRRVVRTTWG